MLSQITVIDTKTGKIEIIKRKLKPWLFNNYYTINYNQRSYIVKDDLELRL